MQKNRQCTCDFNLPSFGLLPSCTFIHQKNVCFGFQSKADGLAFSISEFSSQTPVELLNLPLLKPCRRS